jgi:hypothetical protein
MEELPFKASILPESRYCALLAVWAQPRAAAVHNDMSYSSANMRFKYFCCILLVNGIGYSLSGQQSEPPKAQISATEILERNLIATGGLEAPKALETLVASGEIRLNNTNRIGDYKFSYKSPNNHMLEIRRISHGGIWRGHHEGRPVNRGTSEILGPPEPGELCDWCVTNGVDTWIVEDDWRKLLQWDFTRDYNIELIGIGEVDKRLAYGLRFTPKKGGQPFVCFYDRETFLLVRIDRIAHSRTNKNRAEAVYKVESIFRDYREQGGVKVPFVIAIPRPEGDVVFEVSKIKMKEAIRDSVFE